MRRCIVYIVLGFGLLTGGCKNSHAPVISNQPPKTFFWLFPDSTIREGNSKQRIRWWGEDPDGVIKGFLFASGKFVTGVPASALSDTLAWKWTTRTDSLLAFPLLVRRDTFGIAIRGVDNTFELNLPEGAVIYFGSSPYWDVNENGRFDGGDVSLPTLPGAVDMNGATQKMPLLNQPPSISFAPDPNDPTNTMQQPETTFTAATFSWVGTDPDGDQTITQYEIALNDTSTPSRWFALAGNVKLISLVVPRSRSNGVVGEVDADLYTGTYLTKRKLSGTLQGLKLDSLNTFYVRARDVAGDASSAIKLPSGARKWFVKNPKGKLLIVADLINGTYGDPLSVQAYYRNMFSNQIGGEFATFELLDIARGLTSVQKEASRVGELVPPFIDPAFLFTLHLFDVVFWYTDPYPSLGVAQYPLFQYVRDSEHRGKVIYSTMFRTNSDPRGALRDFAPIDSVSSVDLVTSGRLLPTMGDTRMLDGTQVIPDSSAQGAAFPPLQFNITGNPTHSHLLFMRPIYKRADASYIYYMQDDSRLPKRYVFLRTLSDLRSVSAFNSRAWTCGLNGTIVHSPDGGQSWSLQSSGTKNNLHSIQFLDANTGWSIGEIGTILKTSDAGATWMNKSILTLESFYGIWFSSMTNGVGVGTNGGIIHTSDGGTNWTSLRILPDKNLYSVHFANQNIGVAVGDSGGILRTTDGGASWIVIPRITTRKLNAVRFSTPNIGWIAGANGVNLKSTDAGLTWTVQSAFVPSIEIRSIFFADENTGWVVGISGVVLKTVDGGMTWLQQSSGVAQSLNSISFASANDGVIVGTGGIVLQTSDGGANWTSRPKENLNVGVIDGDKTFVLLALPLHLLDGPGGSSGKVAPFLQYVLTQALGE